MTALIRLIFLISIGVLLNACQSTPAVSPQVIFKDEELRRHHLSLINATAQFDNGTLILSGGVWPEYKQVHVDCGQIQFQIFDTDGRLLKTLNTDYTPCHLHYRPNTRRAGYFSAVIHDLPPQALIIKTSYQRKPHEAH